MSRIEPQNEIEERLKTERWIRRCIESAFIFGDPKLALQGINRMQAQMDLFPQWSLAIYHYVTAMAFFLEEDFDFGHQVLKAAFRLPKPVRAHLPWQIDILDLFFHLEKGNADYVDSVLDSKRKRFRKMAYPAFILKGIDTMLRNNCKVDTEMMDEVERQAGLLPNDQSVVEGKFFFDFERYIKAKACGRSIKDHFGNGFGLQVLSLAI